MKLETSSHCKFCKTEAETVEHYIFHCSQYDIYRKMLIYELGKLYIKQNKINLELLLTGGDGINKVRLKILRIL